MACFAISEGDFLFVKYRGFPLWHQRVVIKHVGENTWAAASPDWDVNLEQFDLRNDWLDGVHHCGNSRTVPAGLQPVYCLGGVTAPRLARARAAATELIAAEGLVVIAPNAPPVVLPLAAPPPPVAGKVWRLLEPAGGALAGTVHQPGAGSRLGTSRGLDTINGRDVALADSATGETGEQFLARFGLQAVAAVVDDARVLPVLTKSDGRRERTWLQVVDMFKDSDMAHFGVSGPRTTTWCVAFLARQQKHPEDYHASWRARHGLNPSDFGVSVHATAMRCLASAACHDQLDVVNLCSMEMLLREAQMIEQFYKEEERSKHDKKMKDQKQRRGLSAEEIDLYLGASKNFSEVMVAPSLTEYISKQLEREASISKNTRKAREERALARV